MLRELRSRNRSWRVISIQLFRRGRFKVGTYEAAEATELILSGKARAPFVVDGAIDLTGKEQLTKLPNGLKCFELNASQTSLTSLPADLQVESSLILRECRNLKKLPAGLTVGTLDLQGCTELEELPEDLDVWFLNLRGCTALTSLPASAKIRNGSLSISGCTGIRNLPSYLKKLSTLDISDCPQITELPPKLEIGLWINVGGSGLTSLNALNKDVGIRWRSVAVDERIAFHPDDIKASEALQEKNAERRRVLIERMGTEKFISEANAKVIDRDKDSGGKRELLVLPLKNDEDLVCLSCFCPSTSRHYFLRVPPTMKTCHQAAAWMAGFDDPALYNPVIET